MLGILIALLVPTAVLLVGAAAVFCGLLLADLVVYGRLW